LATANVFYRDVSHIIQIVIQVLFYVTPIIYSLDDFPSKYRWIFKLNPLVYLLNGFRLSVYYGLLPQFQSIAASFVCAFAALFIGFAFFKKHQHEFVYYV
jgi:ABC-type polysaccharide/polyol phosphate export permease